MMTNPEARPRCAVIAGPYTGGKTTLLEALLAAAGAIGRKGRIAEGNTVGDSQPEARERRMTVTPNIAHFEYLGDAWRVIDCPGSVELGQEVVNALMAADVAIVVAEPEPERAVTAAPLLRFLDDRQIPHMIFINKMDRAAARVRDVLAALQEVSARPLVLRQVPIREGEQVAGVVDLVSERAWAYQDQKPSALIEMPEAAKDRNEEGRRDLLETLADFDDALLEQILDDKEPAAREVYARLAAELAEDRLVPVFLGSAENGGGVIRLLKALRHETPSVNHTAARLGLPEDEDFLASVIKTWHLPHTGKISLARIWRGEARENGMVAGERVGGLIRLQGGQQEKLAVAGPGELVGLARMEGLATGDLVTAMTKLEEGQALWPEIMPPVFALAISPVNRQDEVKLTAAVQKLIDEDASLSLRHNPDTRELVLHGQGEIHLLLAAERLKTRHNVEVTTRPPQAAYRETIKAGVDQHARHKRQTGGHGQFADIKVRVDPLGRGEGFRFVDKIVGGAVPRQYIPAVEAGIKEALQRGPLGFPVVDLQVTLSDGQFHSVDSSEMAFKIAGRMAMNEALPKCRPVLLEPIADVSIFVPSEFTNKVHGLISGRRGQILGFDSRPGWEGWDELRAHMPEAELADIIVELRSLTLGVGSFTARFDHLQEIAGRTAERVVQARQEAVQ